MRTPMMSWEGHPHFRWVKMHKGVRYRVTCADLGLPESQWTKNDSYQPANDWWTAKLATLPGKVREYIDFVSEKVQVEADLDRINRQIATIDTQIDLLQKLGPVVPGQTEALEKQVAVVGVPTPSTSLQFHADRFLELERARIRKASTYGELREYLMRIKRHLPADVSEINENTISSYYLTLRKGSWEPATQKKAFGFFRRFVSYLSMNACVIPVPRNLTLRSFSFPTVHKEIKTYPLEEIRGLLVTLPSRFKLYALLALNCGMLGVDIGSLKHSELDRSNWRITRKRTKTEHTNSPKVCYKLWQETIDELIPNLSDHPTHVLTSSTGTVLHRSWIEGNDEKLKDLIGNQWRKHRFSIPLKAFRSIAATLLEQHPVYGRYKTYFLAQTPRSVADKHYAAPSQELFDEALAWLRERVFPRQKESSKGAKRSRRAG